MYRTKVVVRRHMHVLCKQCTLDGSSCWRLRTSSQQSLSSIHTICIDKIVRMSAWLTRETFALVFVCPVMSSILLDRQHPFTQRR